MWEETCLPIDHLVPGQVCRIIEPELDYDEPWRIIRPPSPISPANLGMLN